MFNKTIKIIIAGIIIAILSFALFFIFKNKNNDKENKAKEAEINARLLEELKTNHPEFSASQLEFYNNLAVKEIVAPCDGRNDENDCISSVAFLRKAQNSCDEINDEKIKIECVNSILQEGNAEAVNKCWLLDSDSFIKCSRELFLIYAKPENCLRLKSSEVQKACESVFYYETAVVQGDTELCKKVTNEKLNLYCIKNINAMDKTLDSDNDGLTDYEERNVYKTDPNKNDTDGDGYSDGIEIRNGYNPLGQ